MSPQRDDNPPKSSSPALPEGVEAARRIVAWDDAGKLADDEWLVENNETAIIAICRALLAAASRERKSDETFAEMAALYQAEYDRLAEALREIKSQCHNLPRGGTADRIEQLASAALSPAVPGGGRSDDEKKD